MGTFKLYRRLTIVAPGVVLLSTLSPPTARAWGPDGHHTVAAIADQLLKGTSAATQVRAILGGVGLEDAAVWADCAKGVNTTTFVYDNAGKFPECAPFENPLGEAAMIDFVKRNATNCNPKPTEETCHKQYHYADIAIQHDHYDLSFVGARNDDVSAAITAAIAVLQNKNAPSPFSIKDQREALLLLTHYVGDIHQPLHVGAIYLDPKGKPVNPDKGQFDPTTETKGGNFISVKASNLHATWDAIPASLKDTKVNAAWVKAAKAVASTTGPISSWSTGWASDTQKEAQKAFANLAFGPQKLGKWSTKLPSSYSKSMSAIKKTQLTKGGARLAQLLSAIWPDAMASDGPAKNR